ncbi:MAG: TonB-dependent receptor [Flavobacteriales bacterium]|nr:MAG: TonB-dependent receptor [Flavobacteriales bacterium]
MMNRLKLNGFLLIFFTLMLSVNTIAQKGIVRGFIYNDKTGEAEIGATVFLKGTTMGAATDVNGFYSITKIPAGSYTLMVTSLGFDSVEVKVSIKGNEIISKNLNIKEGSRMMKTFIVSAQAQEAKTQVKMSVTKVTPKEINSIPAIGGDPDLAQYLQVLPGVTFTGDQGGQLYIRGGSPVQNKVLLDGMIVYNPFHSIGLFSVFDTDIMRSADVYTGGFNAEYGGRISSIMDITYRDGDKKRLRGKLSASTFSSKLMLEGPIKKAKEGKGGITFVVSGKHSYLEQSSEMYKPYFQGLSSENARGVDTLGLPYGFTDLYGKISFNGDNGNKFSVFGFNFRDAVNYSDVSKLNWKSGGGGVNFILIPSTSKTLIEGVVAFSNYKIELQEADNQPRSSLINGFNVGMDFTTFSGDNQFKYGFEMLGFKTNFQFVNTIGTKIVQEENTTELSGFMTYRINVGKMVIEPSVRMQYYASLSTFSPEPRLGFKYNITSKFRTKIAAGMYSQNLISANSDRDIVNLFYGFLSGPDNLQEEFTEQDGTTRPINHKLQKANHYIVGFEYDLSRRFNLNIEGYLKDFKQLTNTNRNQIFDENDDAALNKPDVEKKEFIVETGKAYGVDVVLKYSSTRLNVWTVYSIGKVTRWDGVQEYAPVFDRRHNVNLVVAYTFGKDRNWAFNTRWNLASGFPFTQTQGFYEGYDGTGDYTTSNGELKIEFAELNKGRLPYYHRLDISIKRKFVLGKNSILEANLGATNAYNRDNLFFIDRVTADKVYQLPLMPSFGISLTF